MQQHRHKKVRIKFLYLAIVVGLVPVSLFMLSIGNLVRFVSGLDVRTHPQTPATIELVKQPHVIVSNRNLVVENVNQRRPHAKSISTDNRNQAASKPNIIFIRPLNIIIDDLNRSHGENTLIYLNELWRRAADLQVPDVALIALAQATRSNEPAVASLAETALLDLRKFKQRLEGKNSQQTPTVGESLNMNDLKANLDSSEFHTRSLAMQQLNTIRSPAAFELLVNASQLETDSQLRYQAIMGIWISAAHGIGDQQQALLALQTALSDDNQRNSALAQSAISDLNRLGEHSN